MATLPSSSANRGPAPAYVASHASSPLHADAAFYSAIHAADKRLVTSDIVPIRSGYAWRLRAGQVCRLTTPEGPQVGDLNLWARDNPRERFWASRTRQLQASHVRLHDRLWSCLPYVRPMCTVTGDSLGERFGDAESGLDEDGARVHDLLGTRCDPYINQVLTGEDFDFHCHSNLTRAVQPLGLQESDVHDVLNVFQVTGLNRDGKYYMKTCPARSGDYFEFFAEIDLLCAISTCPGGDLSRFAWGGPASQNAILDCCRPLGVEVYDLVDEDNVLAHWKPPQPSSYAGNHGLVRNGAEEP